MDAKSSVQRLPWAKWALWSAGAGLLVAASCSDVTVIEMLGTSSPGGGGSAATTSTTGGSAGTGGHGGGTGLAGGGGALGGTGGDGGIGLAGGGGGTGGTGGSGATGGDAGGSPPCGDGVRDGMETDVDCGGPECPPCADCLSCTVATDCTTGWCEPATHTCAPRWLDIAVGDDNSCSRKSDGSLWCWGDNVAGQIGNGTFVPLEPLPSQVSALGTSVAQAAVGSKFTCGLEIDRRLWCWGRNDHGQLGQGGVSADQPSPAQVTALGSSVAKVALGVGHGCAVKLNGSLWCWGENADGQLGRGTTTAFEPAPGQVVAVGGSVADVSLGYSYTCARKTNGSLWCWGRNDHGQLGDGTTSGSSLPVQVTALGASVAEISLGYAHACVRKTNGSLWCWGNNPDGEVGDGSQADRDSPVQISVLGTSVATVSLGYMHTCASKTDGSLWCWGSNWAQQLGSEIPFWAVSPLEVTALGAPAETASLGHGHTCALTAGGLLWCWGWNEYGQLGDGTVLESVWPLLVQTPACP